MIFCLPLKNCPLRSACNTFSERITRCDEQCADVEAYAVKNDVVNVAVAVSENQL